MSTEYPDWLVCGDCEEGFTGLLSEWVCPACKQIVCGTCSRDHWEKCTAPAHWGAANWREWERRRNALPRRSRGPRP